MFLNKTFILPSKFINIKAPITCFNCSKVGHHADNCKNNPKCPKCGENHSLKNCKSNELKCPNCGGSHLSFSKNCSFYQTEIKKFNEPKTHIN